MLLPIIFCLIFHPIFMPWCQVGIFILKYLADCQMSLWRLCFHFRQPKWPLRYIFDLIQLSLKVCKVSALSLLGSCYWQLQDKYHIWIRSVSPCIPDKHRYSAELAIWTNLGLSQGTWFWFFLRTFWQAHQLSIRSKTVYIHLFYPH